MGFAQFGSPGVPRGQFAISSLTFLHAYVMRFRLIRENQI